MPTPTTPAATAPARGRRRRGAAGWPLLGGRGGALTLAPWPSVLVITSSVQAGLGLRGRKPGQIRTQRRFATRGRIGAVRCATASCRPRGLGCASAVLAARQAAVVGKD